MRRLRRFLHITIMSTLKPTSFPNTDPTIGIIGYGDFGTFIHTLVGSFMPEARVKVFARRKEVDNELFFSLEEVSACDFVFLSVPIHSFETVLQSVVPHVGKNTILFDISTVKVYTTNILRKHAEHIQYVATHPMFGPYSYEKRGHHLEGLRVALCEHNLKDEGIYQTIHSLLTDAGLVILEVTPEEHDRMLAETLFLTHFVAQTLVAGGFKRTEIDTLSFGFMMDAIESVKNDVELFHDVYQFNPYCDEVLERLQDARTSVIKNLKEKVED